MILEVNSFPNGSREFNAVQDLSFSVQQGEIIRADRPERRGKIHGLRQ
jgi:ABC-type uncharacterized transport system ATPase subunit